MKQRPIPENHVLHIKRDGDRLQLELMRFLKLGDAKIRRERHYQRRPA